ncbi:response regulator [Candidatus Poribacteria bacterium]|nr:response regulator [Candidatus Poribacteria bacterium]
MKEDTIRILLIEDNDDYYQIIEIMLVRELGPNFEIDWSESLKSGIENLNSGKYDVILLDLSLTDSWGLDTFTEVYKNASETAIVVLSGIDDENIATEAVHKGAQDYLVKDRVDGKLLARSIKYAIERKNIAEELKRTNLRLRESQEKLKQWNKELEKEVKKRTQDLTKANEELEQANKILRKQDKEKTEFLRTVAHDLRTPLTSIRAYADMVLMYRNESQETHEEFLNIIIHECVRLSNLVNNLLNLELIKSGKMDYDMQPLDLTSLIDHIVSVFQGQAGNLKISLESHIPDDLPMVNGNQDRLSQVVSNLISNAVKFTPPGGKINVKLEKNDGEILVSVSDTGVGVPEEYHSKIFEKFGRGKMEGETVKEGVGLGLAIAKKIVEQHNGRIWVESPGRGKGSTFTFTLPYRVRREKILVEK